jgi:hypothetical protein
MFTHKLFLLDNLFFKSHFSSFKIVWVVSCSLLGKLLGRKFTGVISCTLAAITDAKFAQEYSLQNNCFILVFFF